MHPARLAPPPWILLRGLTRETGHWGAFYPLFERAMAPGAVLAVDLPGNGALHAQRSPATVAALLAHVRGQLQRAGVAPPYRLLAMSLGAMVGTAWAQAVPEELAGCVFINTSLRPFSAFYQRLQPQSYPGLVRMAWPGATPAQQEAQVLKLTSNRTAAHANAALLSRWMALRQQHPVSRANALRQLLAAARFRARLQPPSVSILLLTSRRDRLVAPVCSQALAAHWRCALQTHPDAGHDLPLDDGAWVVRAVQHWLARYSAPT